MASSLTLADFDSLRVGRYRDGAYISAVCLFHDDRGPSLLIYADGRYWCKGCGAHGNFEALKRQMDKVGPKPKPAQAFRAAWLGLPEDAAGERTLIETSHQLLRDNPSLGWYLDQRGISDQSIRDCRLGYWQGWITLPVRVRTGDYQGLMLRATPNVERRTGLRFLDTGRVGGRLYVPNWSRLDRPYMVVVFGMLDAVSLAQLGYLAATNTDGKGHFKPEYLDFWRKPVYVIGDAGEEFEAMRRELMHGLGWRGHAVRFPWSAGVKDVNDYLRQRRTGELVRLLGRTLPAGGTGASGGEQGRRPAGGGQRPGRGRPGQAG